MNPVGERPTAEAYADFGEEARGSSEVFTAWALPIGAFPTAVALTLWFWPTAPGHHVGAGTHRIHGAPVEEAP